MTNTNNNWLVTQLPSGEYAITRPSETHSDYSLVVATGIASRKDAQLLCAALVMREALTQVKLQLENFNDSDRMPIATRRLIDNALAQARGEL